jgi:tetratricopeptide (TPR) repeat protein
MRFVAGRTLAEAVADYHARRATTQAGRLELAALLDAFVAVCRAIAYAHSHGILHRDLKGQNVVLGDFGEVFLIDWGLAKPVGEADLTPTPAPAPAGPDQPTRSGAVVGTPAYMAPEVAAGGPATKASDVYGLGAVLYAILTGRPPYDGADPWTVVEKVIATDPPPPRAVNPDAPPALEAVCRRAMARDPAGRYGSADELATEVRRWLADEPVAAYRDPWTVRATRWARRHRTTVAAATVFLLTALVALTASTALVWNEQRRTAEQKRIAEGEWTRAEAERERAEGNFALAWDLTSGLSDAATAVETGTAPPPRSDPERRQFLDRALTASERFLADRPDDRELRDRTARLLRYAGNLGRLLNDTAKADRSYLESVRLQEGPLGQPPDDPERRDYLSQTLRDYAVFQKRVGRLAEAAGSIDRAVGIAEALRASDPTSTRHRRTLAVALLDRAGIDHPRGRFAESERGARAAADTFGDLMTAPPGQRHSLDPLLRAMATTQAAMARRELARSAADPESFAAALAAHDAAVGQYEELLKTDESRDVRHNYYRSLVQRSRTAAAAGRRDAGLADLDRAVGGWEKLVREYPATPLYQEGLATGRLARAAAGPADRAEQDLTAAVKVLEDLARQHQNLPAYRGLLGEAWAGLARLPADRAVAGDRVRRSAVSYRTAIRWDPGNVLYARAYQEAQREWKAAGLEAFAAPPKK